MESGQIKHLMFDVCADEKTPLLDIHLRKCRRMKRCNNWTSFAQVSADEATQLLDIHLPYLLALSPCIITPRLTARVKYAPVSATSPVSPTLHNCTAAEGSGEVCFSGGGAFRMPEWLHAAWILVLYAIWLAWSRDSSRLMMVFWGTSGNPFAFVGGSRPGT